MLSVWRGGFLGLNGEFPTVEVVAEGLDRRDLVDACRVESSVVGTSCGTEHPARGLSIAVGDEKFRDDRRRWTDGWRGGRRLGQSREEIEEGFCWMVGRGVRIDSSLMRCPSRGSILTKGYFAPSLSSVRRRSRGSGG
jgi:hypothetical protein